VLNSKLRSLPLAAVMLSQTLVSVLTILAEPDW
jgi:hypothetical protein